MNLADATVSAAGLTGSFWAAQVKPAARLTILGLVRGSTTAQGMADVFRGLSNGAGSPETQSSGWRVFSFRSADVAYGGANPSAHAYRGAYADVRPTSTYDPDGAEDVAYPATDFIDIPSVCIAEVEEGVPVWFIPYPPDYVPRTIEVRGRTLMQGIDFRLHGHLLLFFENPLSLFPGNRVVCSSGRDRRPSLVTGLLSLDGVLTDVAEVSLYHWRSHSISQFFRAAVVAAGYRFSPKGGAVRHGQNLAGSAVYLMDHGAEEGTPGLGTGDIVETDRPLGEPVRLMSLSDLEMYGYFPLGLLLGGEFRGVWIATGNISLTVTDGFQVLFPTYERDDNGTFTEDSGAYASAVATKMAASGTNLYTKLTGIPVLGTYFENDVIPFNLLRALAREGILERIVMMAMWDITGHPSSRNYARIRQFVDDHRPTGVACHVIPFTP